MKKLYEEAAVQAIADAIREKNGSSDTYKPGEMASAILAIPTGGGGTTDLFYSWDEETLTLTVTEVSG